MKELDRAEQELEQQTKEDVVVEVENDNDAQQGDDLKDEEVTLSEEELRIQDLETQVKELNDRLLRVQADYDNFRRRTRQEKEAAAKYRSQSLLEELIPAIDNFDRALGVNAESDEAKSIQQGMEMVYRQLTEALKNEGLEVIAAVGQDFDPHYHQAVMQVESEDYQPNVVVEELQKGYKLKDRVIRPSMVKVSQ
ncbi:nucleotide exchange factor GrpE [Anaerobacillus alkalidiazotrophicus]|uniref:Protein GrpE n=1 Tax=Anaerobacillus alkalidiazotrophicus TaxID=472963 RepID=A0A1S2MBH6_9BACI|nr:nucleotide exchange factor GrpE [Anaerobacillus alkalidiazotrophicus]